MAVSIRSKRAWSAAVVVGFLLLATLAAATQSSWRPLLVGALGGGDVNSDSSHAHEDDALDHADHDRADHDARASIELSDRGLKNIGYEPLAIEPSDYHRKLSLPAIVVERPGRSQIHVTAPLTGTVTKIYAVTGEAVGQGAPLFDLRLTHEELVAAQREFLETTAQLDIVARELERLRGLGEGVIAGKLILEKQYEQQKLQATLLASKQAMLLHGLTADQIAGISQSRELFQNITISTPEHTETDEACEGPHLFTVQQLRVAKGEHVELGAELTVLADHCELHIEALAFEDDAPQIRRASEADREVAARLLGDGSQGALVEGLEVLYVASEIDPQTRAFKAYLRLPNEIALDKTTPQGKRFIEWIYKPGQRMQVNVPVERWEKQIVLPSGAVVSEGAENFVYRQNGKEFEQVPVQVLHRDQRSVVVANDGALFKGDVIAAQGAYQMHLALRNKSGSAIDPHAGHGH